MELLAQALDKIVGRRARQSKTVTPDQALRHMVFRLSSNRRTGLLDDCNNAKRGTWVSRSIVDRIMHDREAG